AGRGLPRVGLAGQSPADRRGPTGADSILLRGERARRGAFLARNRAGCGDTRAGACAPRRQVGRPAGMAGDHGGLWRVSPPGQVELALDCGRYLRRGDLWRALPVATGQALDPCADDSARIRYGGLSQLGRLLSLPAPAATLSGGDARDERGERRERALAAEERRPGRSTLWHEPYWHNIFVSPVYFSSSCVTLGLDDAVLLCSLCVGSPNSL